MLNITLCKKQRLVNFFRRTMSLALFSIRLVVTFQMKKNKLGGCVRVKTMENV